MSTGIYPLAFPIRDLEESSGLGEGSSLPHTSSPWLLYQCGVLGEGESAASQRGHGITGFCGTAGRFQQPPYQTPKEEY